MIENFKEEYISGNKFKALADEVIEYPMFDNSTGLFDRILGKSCIIYCAPSYLTNLFNLLKGSNNKYVLITHNHGNVMEDFELTQDKYEFKPECIVKWFSRDVRIDKPDIEFLPLGLFNDQEDIERMPSIMKVKSCTDKAYCNFTIHPYPKIKVEDIDNGVTEKDIIAANLYDRYWLYKNIRGKPFVEWEPSKIETREYLERIATHLFVISPSGFCVDCYRTWESIYLESIPIVRRNKIYDGYPVLQIDNWNDLNAEMLSAYNARRSDFDFNCNKLKMSYWSNRIAESRFLLQ